MHADDQNSDVRQAANDLPRGVDAIESRHGDIENGNMRLVFDSAANGLRAIARGHDLPSSLLVKYASNALSKQSVIVGNENPDNTHLGLSTATIGDAASAELASGAVVAADIGSSIVSRVPFAAPLSTSSRPPSRVTRSRTPTSPIPGGSLSALRRSVEGIPFPSSSTVTNSECERRCRKTRHDRACACLATLVKASCTTR